MRKIFAFFVSLFLAVSSAAAEPLRVGVIENYPPQFMITAEGQPYGYAIELVEELSTRAGYTPEYSIYATWSEAQQSLARGEIDIIPSKGITAEKTLFATFTETIETLDVSVFVRDSTRGIKGLNDLTGRSVGVVRTNVGLSILREQPGLDLQIFESGQVALFSLLSGEVDALVYSEPVVWRMANNAAVGHLLSTVGEPLAEIKRAIAVQRDQTEIYTRLNTTLQAFMREPAFEALYAKWHGEQESWISQNIYTLLITASFVILSLLLFVIFGIAYSRSLLNLNRQLDVNVRDRTDALKVSQDRFKSFAEISSDWFWEMDQDLRFSYMSPSFTDITGIPIENILGKCRSDMYGADIDPRVLKELDELQAMRSAYRNVHYSIKNDQGKVIHLSLSAIPVFDDQGEFTGYRGTGANITKEVQFQRDLAEERDRAVEANEAKSLFLAKMSHEIRTPLTGILGAAEVLPATKDPEAGASLVEAIRASGHLLLSILNDLLDQSKIESGKIQVSEAPFDLHECVQHIYYTFKANADRKGITLAVEFQEGVSRRVLGDATHLKQVLLNLVGNAVKFTDTGSVHLLLRQATDQGVHFSVQDTGTGISKDNQERLFRPFEQMDEARNQKKGGTGLGLSIAKELVTLMGGQIQVQSQPGVGSTFEFELRLPPVSEATLSEATLSEASQETVVTAPVEPASYEVKILLAEDNKINQMVMTALLSDKGYSFDLAENGREAVAAVESKPDYDVILMDIRMPEMDGIEAFKIIRHMPGPASDIPIIAVTADATPEFVQEFLSLGFDAVEPKPIDTQSLYKSIDACLAAEPKFTIPATR